MSKKTLGVSWLNGNFRVVACRGNKVKASWEKSSPVEHPGEMAPLLREAVKKTHYKGADVHLVLDHRQLVYHLQDAPLGKPSSLKSFLQRKVAQNQFYEESAAWSYHSPVPGQDKQRFLLTLLPDAVVRGLVGAFDDAGLVLSGIFSPGALLAAQLPQLHLQSNESALLVADLGGVLCLVAGTAGGDILFCRHLSCSTPAMRARAGQEINRTLLYVQQQFGVSINTLWVYGGESLQWLSKVVVRDGMTVRPSPVEKDDCFFARQVTRVPSLSSSNLVPLGDIRRRHLRRISSLGAVSLMLAAVAISALVDREIKRRDVVYARWKQTWNKLEQQRTELLFRQQEILLLERSLADLGNPKDPPVVNLFTRYLSQAVPEDLKLSGFAMARRDDGGFDVRLEGFSQNSTVPFLPLVEDFERELTDGIFHVKITGSTRQDVLRVSEKQSLQISSQAGLHTGLRTFFISGFLP